jgi:hypothetical protein
MDGRVNPHAIPGVGAFPPPMVYVRDEARWEYRLLTRNLAKADPPSEAELNALGDDGWELAGLFTDSPFLYLYFKRMK